MIRLHSARVHVHLFSSINININHNIVLFFFFFFNDPATPEIYTLSLHDALPISGEVSPRWASVQECSLRPQHQRVTGVQRSEEHTSELQSLAYLVCRLLLEKKKKRK